jgi:hypothetical protein
MKRLNGIVSQLSKTNELDEKGLNSEATRLLRELDMSVRKMETEAKAAPPSTRRELTEQLTALKSEVGSARSALQKANDTRARASLMKPDKAKAMEEAAVDKLQSAVSRQSNNTLILQQAQAQLNDTQDIGVRCVQLCFQRRALLH